MADYLTFNGSDDSVNLTVAGADHSLVSGDPLSVTIKFRTSSTAARGILFHDYHGGSGREYYIDINATNAGYVRFVGFDGGSNFFVPNNGANIADGNWHVLTGVREAQNLHRWFLDGAQVGSDISTAIGTAAAVGNRYLGAYQDGSLNYNGDIQWVATHDKAISLAEHQAMNSGGIPQDVTGATTYMYACGPAGAASWGNDHLNMLFGSGFDSRAPLAVETFPSATSDGGPANLDPATLDTVKAIFRTARIIAPGAASASDEKIREIGNIYATGNGYALVYAGHPNNDMQVQIHLATSADGTTWSKQGVIIAQATHGFYTEDPYVYYDGSTYWLLCESKGAGGGSQAGIALFHSADGETSWTLDDSDMLALGGGGAFDSQDVSSPVMWKEGSTYYLLYEGRSSGDNGKVGLATAAAPTGTWTKDAGNPVLSPAGSGWSGTSIVPDDILKVGSTYYMLLHALGTIGGASNYRCGIYESSNLTTWTEPSGHFNPVTSSICNTLMRSAVDTSHLHGVDESGTNSQSILRYDMYKAEVAATGGAKLLSSKLIESRLLRRLVA